MRAIIDQGSGVIRSIQGHAGVLGIALRLCSHDGHAAETACRD